jgi:DNA-3-methyladenine glycosylase I
VLKALGDNAQGQRLHACDGLVSVLAVAHHAGQGGHFGEPPAIVFALDFYRERHVGNVPFCRLRNKAMNPTSTQMQTSRTRMPLNTDIRCGWARTPLSIAYHDVEWGVPVHDDRVLFEFLTLEGAQAGLSWETILKKREAYREAFLDFDPAHVARFTPSQVERLRGNPGIVRNRLKIVSTVGNAKAVLRIQREFGSFDAYVWGFVGGLSRVNRWRSLEAVPARTPESDALSRDLSRRGFTFVGSTICYAFMQAVGLVNDHTVDCFRYQSG